MTNDERPWLRSPLTVWARLGIGPWALGIVVAVSLAAGAPFAHAADDENRAFNAAAKAFQDGFAARAEAEFASFVRQFTNSARLPDAILLQARAAFSQTNFDRAIALLTMNMDRAGPLVDQYRFWLGQIRIDSGDYKGAAAEFGQLVREHTNSTRRLEAAYGEARARFKLGEWAQTVELLRQPGGAFQQAAQAEGDADVVARGQLLLAEALLKQHEYAEAEAAARRVPTNLVDVAWSREFVLSRIQLATDRAETALHNTTNLISWAAASGRAEFKAESYSLQGTILEALGQFEAALSAYGKVQAETMPDEQRRAAFLKIIELTLEQDNVPLAAEKLQSYLAAYPEDAAADEVLLTLGELRLKEHFRPATNNVPPPGTNHLQLALLRFEQLIQRHPESPLIGKAHLNRGWALLADQKTVEAQAAFKLAAEKLPFAADQAIARFKLADTYFLQQDYTNALAGYRRVIEDYSGLPRVRTGLFDRAWYQIARACLKVGDLAGANDAMRKILVLYPASLYAERMLLLYGQELARANQPAQARAVFVEFTQQYTNSPLLSEVQMAIARSHELENQWSAAIETYDALLARFPTNEIAPRAEFHLALAQDRAGRETNALHLLTNFLARFQTHALAPRAQDWIGDYYFRKEEFTEAERNYQWLYQNTNWPAGELIMFQAKFKAGRAAFLRQGYDDAASYFLNLINDKQCPQPVVAQAFFAYGDTLISRGRIPGITNALAQYETAIEIFRKIPQLYPASPLVPRALGRMADCYFQIAGQDARRYTNALALYERAHSAAEADLDTRSQAEVGLGNVLLRQAQLTSPPDAKLLDAALNHYLNVVYGKNLREGEVPIPLWVKEAGFKAAQILESQQDWRQAINLYGRLEQLLPPLRSSLEKRAMAAREQLRRGRDRGI